MDSKNQNARFLLIPAVIALSGALFYFGTGLRPIWWLTWLAPLPVLWFAGRCNTHGEFWIAFGAGLLGGLNWWRYLYGVIELPRLVCVVAVAFPALLFALCVLLWRRLLTRGQVWLAAFSLPLAWTSVGFLQQEFSPHSTFGNIAYSQMDFLPLIQIASLTGIWGIAFVLLLIPSTLAVLFHHFTAGKGIAAFTLACFMLLTGFGIWRLHTPLEVTGTIRAQLMSNDARGEIYSEEDSRSLALLKKYTTAEMAKSADVTVMPEKIARFSAQGAEQARAALSDAAKSHNLHIIAGLDEVRGGNRRNDALFFAPNGSVVIDYEKHHFVPGLEVGYLTGTDYAVSRQPSGVWGIAICKDMDFPEMGRQYAKRGAGLLLVPAWDFTMDDWYHARMAILRGVESGFSIARSAKRGLLTVSDNRGRIRLEKSGSLSGMVTAEVLVPVARAETLYSRWGDWFPWLCIPGFLVCLFAGFRRIQSAKA
jgi:apolipoprotein N-acyltransferase